jgi:anti-sigma B factor antagonist
VQIETRQADGVLILTPLDQRIDAYMAAAFRTALIDRIDAGARRITIDLHRVDFMDSSGLGALVSALKRIGKDGELRVCSPKPGVRSMFELTRLNRVIPILEAEPGEVGAAAR